MYYEHQITEKKLKKKHTKTQSGDRNTYMKGNSMMRMSSIHNFLFVPYSEVNMRSFIFFKCANGLAETIHTHTNTTTINEIGIQIVSSDLTRNKT